MSQDSPGRLNSQVLQGVRDGKAECVGEVVDVYFARIVRAAEKRISESKLRIIDGDDVAASVVESFWKRAEKGGFTGSDFQDGPELWRFLFRLTCNKVTDNMRRERAAKRGGGVVRGDSVFFNSRNDQDVSAEVPAPSGFSPDEFVEFSERHEIFLEALGSNLLKEIVTLRLEGYQVSEIAEEVGLCERSIKRKLALIRDRWTLVASSLDDDG